MIKIENIIRVDWITKGEVEKNKKTDLKKYEYLGIEELIDQLIKSFEYDNYGQIYTNIKDYTFFRSDQVKLNNEYSFEYKFDKLILIKAFISDKMVIAEFYDQKKEEYNYYRID